MPDIPLRCTCGMVRGVVKDAAAHRGNHVTCMCDDCQCYVHWLGRVDDVLDAYGGTPVYQTAPANVTITEGMDHVRCVRLGPKGLMRWYAGCCRTPIGNTLASPKVPLFGIILAFADFDSAGLTAQEALGPLLLRAWGRFGKGELPPDAHPKAPPWFVLRSLRLFGGFWLRGQARPSPVFDAHSGRPVVEPTVVPLEERERLRTLVTASAEESAARTT